MHTLGKQAAGIFALPQGRIEWVDIAKGVAIILVIVGHSLEYSSGMRNVIYSFHMPLFFLLSGYTYRMANDRATFIRHVKKGCKHLLLPCLFVVLVFAIAWWWQGNVHDAATLWQVAKRMADALWWASAITVRSHLGINIAWFLVSLFWAKFLIDALHLLFPGKHTGALYVFLGFAGIALGSRGKWLPQNMDVTFVAVLFLYLGMLWRRHHDLIEKYAEILFLVAVAVWGSCLCLDQVLNMSGRQYPYLALSIVEAVFASFAVCRGCMTLAQNAYVRGVTLFIGVHTMLIFLVHCLDWMAVPLWQTSSYWLTCATRVGFVLAVAFLVHLLRCCWQRWRIAHARL